MPTAPFLAEDKANIDDGKQNTDYGDTADPARNDRAQQTGIHKARVRAVRVTNDLHADDFLAQRLAFGAEQINLDNGEREKAERDEDKRDRAHRVIILPSRP